MTDTDWQDVGAAADFAARSLTEITLGRTKLVLSHHKGVFGVISGVCNHVGGPLGQGKLDGNYVVCPLAQLEIPSRHRLRRTRLGG